MIASVALPKAHRDVIRNRLSNNTIILVFANSAYSLVLDNWMIALDSLSIDNFVVVALDKDIHALLINEDRPAIFHQFRGDLSSFWRFRTAFINQVLEMGVSTLHSDADAVWLQDPRELVESCGTDMVFSQGTIWPPDVCQKWGFVLCCGFFQINPTEVSMRFMGELQGKVQSDQDDQAALNRLLMKRQILWKTCKKQKFIYSGVDYACADSTITGTTPNGLTVSVLSNLDVQRVSQPHTDSPKVVHPISKKNAHAVQKCLHAHGAWFL